MAWMKHETHGEVTDTHVRHQSIIYGKAKDKQKGCDNRAKHRSTWAHTHGGENLRLEQNIGENVGDKPITDQKSG